MSSNSKHFVSAPSLVVASARGVVASHPGLILAEADKVVYRPLPPASPKVTLISGGGSGHEPAHTGYVGQGMLDAAVCGEIFASPTAHQIAAGLRAVDSPKGTLVIVKNYTGDVLNFALAVERARAQGKDIETVTVADDVAVGREKGALVGRRGLAGTVLVHKVAGAAAEKGLDLAAVASIARSVASNLATVGASLGHCHVPGREPDAGDAGLRPDELEIGMGIHNEPGYRRLSPVPPHPQIVAELLALMLDPSDADRGFLAARRPADPAVLLANNLGGLSNLELGALVAETVRQLADTYAIVPVRVYAGAFMTSLNAPGFSLTLLALPPPPDTAAVLALLDAPTTAPGWSPSLPPTAWTAPEPPTPPCPAPSTTPSAPSATPSSILSAPLTSRILHSILTQVTLHEPTMTDYDTVLGDGDCGITLLSCAQSLLDSQDILATIEGTMGGTSGALYGIFFAAFFSRLPPSPSPPSFEHVVAAARHALDTLQKYTPARVGDRTLMDALIPFVDTLHARRSAGTEPALVAAVAAADAGYQATPGMLARLGRASYVGQSDATAAVPDPGALGIVAVVRGILEGVREV